MSDDEMRTQDYLQLSSVYALLSRLWLQQVDMDLLEALNEPDMKEAFEAMGGFVPPANEQTLEELTADYCQLLIGPKNQISPSQSDWEDDDLKGQSVASMKRYMETLPTFEPQGNVDDHIGVQLGFMAELFIQASAAEHPDAHEEIATHFIADHFSWSGPFLQKVQEQSQSGFYRGLAALSREFLAFDFEDIDDSSNDRT